MSVTPLVVGDRVRCVGELMTDVVAHVPEHVAAASDTRASVRLTSGGAAANTAAWLAELRVPVALSARVGDDAAGRALVDDLDRRGVDTAGVEVDAARPTGACLVMVDATGERTMIPDAGANVGLAAVGWQRGEHLHVSAYALFHPGVREVVRDSADAARRGGGSVSLDLASAAPLLAVRRDTVREWCDGALVLANLDEATALTDHADPGAAVRVLASWGRAAVVKAGRDGAWLATEDTVVRVPVPAVVDPVDSTGAGDAFAAGLLAALLHRSTVAESVVAGHAVAARVVIRFGARP